MKKNFFLLTAAVCLNANLLHAQETVEKEPEVPRHYMPLYLDVPAEMNVPKGYKEINIGGGYADFKQFNGARTLIEYDFAPVRRLGFEIEVPFIFVHHKEGATAPSPAKKRRCMKRAAHRKVRWDSASASTIR